MISRPSTMTPFIFGGFNSTIDTLSAVGWGFLGGWGKFYHPQFQRKLCHSKLCFHQCGSAARSVYDPPISSSPAGCECCADDDGKPTLLLQVFRRDPLRKWQQRYIHIHFAARHETLSNFDPSSDVLRLNLPICNSCRPL